MTSSAANMVLRKPSNLESNVGNTDLSRRDIAGALVGALGLAALNGCANEARGNEREDVARVASALASGSVAWVDSVLGWPPAPAAARTGYLANNVGGAGSALGVSVVIAAGCVSAGDGGGGIFYWDSSSSTGDDGGTIIVPNGSTTGRWKRLMGDLPVYNIMMFGLVASPYVDATDAINRATAAAHAAGGGIVYVPPGSWSIMGTANPPYVQLYANVALHGSPSANGPSGEGGWASRLVVQNQFPANTSVVRLANQATMNGEPTEIRHILFEMLNTSSNVVAVDFTGVSWGRLEDVGVAGDNVASPPQAAGQTGLLLSDAGGTSCWFNTIERLSISNVDVGVALVTAGNLGLNAINGFEIMQANVGLEFGGQNYPISLTLTNGYVASPLRDSKFTGTLPGYDPRWLYLTVFNVSPEPAAMASDVPLFMFTQGGYPGQTNAFFRGFAQADAFKTTLDARGPTEAPGAGSSPALAVPPNGASVGPAAFSLWAKVPTGTVLTPGAGANTFVFHANALLGQPGIPAGLVATCKPVDDGGIGAPFTMFVSTDHTTINGSRVVVYTVTVNVATRVTLSTDLVFFLEAHFAAP